MTTLRVMGRRGLCPASGLSFDLMRPSFGNTPEGPSERGDRSRRRKRVLVGPRRGELAAGGEQNRRYAQQPQCRRRDRQHREHRPETVDVEQIGRVGPQVTQQPDPLARAGRIQVEHRRPGVAADQATGTFLLDRLNTLHTELGFAPYTDEEDEKTSRVDGCSAIASRTLCVARMFALDACAKSRQEARTPGG